MSSWDRYPTYLVYDSLMRRFATTYPEICKLDTIGFSVDNRLILALKISSNPHSSIDKPISHILHQCMEMKLLVMF